LPIPRIRRIITNTKLLIPGVWAVKNFQIKWNFNLEVNNNPKVEEGGPNLNLLTRFNLPLP